jgi:hypothetical protein
MLHYNIIYIKLISARDASLFNTMHFAVPLFRITSGYDIGVLKYVFS